MKYRIPWILLLAATIFSRADALPPPRPGTVDARTNRFLHSGERVPSFPDAMRWIRPSAPGGALRPAAAGTAATYAGPLRIGTAGDASVTPLILLIDFDNTVHTHDAAEFSSLFFGNGARDLSVKNYWEEVSYTRQGTNLPGKSFRVLQPTPGVVGWLRAGDGTGGTFLTNVRSYADLLDANNGANVAKIQELITDAVSYLDNSAGPGAAWNVTFSGYRGPAGPAVQAVILVHPGFGAEETGRPSRDVYSHQAEFTSSYTTRDGSVIGDYIIVPESQFYNDPTPTDNTADDPLIGIGVIVHEMGHLFGLPDLYPTLGLNQADNTFSGVGVYDLMGYGMWGSDLLIRADTPAHLSAWSKARLGWVVPQVQDNTALSSLVLRPSEYFPDVHQVYPSSVDPTQWFLIENRQRTDTTAPAPPWLFDNFLPGAGVLIWHIDDQVIQAGIGGNAVNIDNNFKGVDLEEANGRNLLGKVPPTPADPNEIARFFGQSSDYFTKATDEFSRARPVPWVEGVSGVNETNSTPIVGLPAFVTGARPPDAKDNVTLGNFLPLGQTLPDGTGATSMLYDLTLSGSGGGGGVALWKTFNDNTTLKYPLDNTVPGPTPMLSNNILSIAFDSGNNVWMGSRDRGIFRFTGTRFEYLGTFEGLPSSPIRTMAFEQETGSMWVGTDSGLFKVRRPGAAFGVQASFTAASPPSPAGPRRIASNSVQAIAVRRGFDVKYVGTPLGLDRVLDGFTDSPSDDSVAPLLSGNVTALAIDDNATPDVPTDDMLWVGFADGRFTRSLLPQETGGPINDDPVSAAHFKAPAYSLDGSPRVTALAVDSEGRLWIGTDGFGVQVFDLGELAKPAEPNQRDPYDFDGDGNRQEEVPGVPPAATQVYLSSLNPTLPASRRPASNRVTGIAIPAASGQANVAWLSHVPDVGSPGDPTGGATRVDVSGGAVTVFRPESGVAAEDQVNGPCSRWLGTAASDSAGNVWFGSTDNDPRGASRFGNAGILTLDSPAYVNVSVEARVTLQDDGLNARAGAVERPLVWVRSSADSAGFLLRLTETGQNTGIFTGSFGFTLGATVGSGPLPVIRVENSSTVTVTYFDFNPPGTRIASAVWKRVYPFEDSLFVGDFSCFIATAAYGSPMAREVRMLRRFRDECLMGNPAGRAFVSFYYRVSPSLAALIARSAVLRQAARSLLAPAILFAGLAVGAGPAEAFGAVVVLAGIAVLLFVSSRRRAVRN